jgi:phosphoribosylamine--glycine ligase
VTERFAAVLGGDGRASAITKCLTQEGVHVYAIGGNVGIARWPNVGYLPALDIAATAIQLIQMRSQLKGTDKPILSVVSSEAPLCEGIVDKFNALNLPIVGPTKKAAEIEGSKVFSAKMCQEANIPSPKFKVFKRGDVYGAKNYVRKEAGPWVLKYDGLFRGKGVLVTSNPEEAYAFIEKFSPLGAIVFQEYLNGQECSFQVFTDGHTAIPLLPSRDYKLAFDGNKGPNTGGMGSYAPYCLSSGQHRQIMDTIVQPTLRHMESIGRLYRGALYFGLMIMPDGQILVLEFNCRQGDPETESVLPLLQSNFYDILLATTQDGQLEKITPIWSSDSAVTVTLTADDYAKGLSQGGIITGIEEAEKIPGVLVFPASVARMNEQLATNGERIVHVTGVRPTIQKARENAYAGVKQINFPGKRFRRDIAEHAAYSTA